MLILATTVFGLSFFVYGAALAPFVSSCLFLLGHHPGHPRHGFARHALRTGLGVADLADPERDLALRRGVLSPVDPAFVDADRRSGPATLLCVRRHAEDPLAGQGADWSQLALAAGLVVVYLVLAFLTFASVYRFAMRTGLIARYSAETAG